MRPLTRLNLYLFREVLTAFLFASVAVSFVVLFTQSFRFLSFVIDNASTALIFVKLMGLLVPTFLPVIIPLGLGISVLFVYHKLAVDSEIVVMRAAGISPRRLAAPALVLAAGALILGLTLTTWITPLANRALVSLQYSVRDNFSVYLVRPGAFNDVGQGMTFFVRKRGKEGELRDILVHDVRQPDRPVTIMADSGRFTLVGGEPQIMVFKGKRQEFDRKTGRLSQLDFDSYALDLKLLRSGMASRPPDPREQTMKELLNPPADRALRRRPVAHSRAEFHRRLATPFLALSYAFIGLAAVLAGEFSRRGMTKRIIIAAVAIVATQAAVLSLGSMITRHSWLIPAFYALVLSPVPFCIAILRSPDFWWRVTRWKARCCPLARGSVS